MPPNDGQEKSETGVNIPKWFLVVTGGGSTLFVGLFVPWALWVSWTLMTISIKSELSETNAHKWEELATNFQAHVGDPNIHAAGKAELKRDIIDIERRLVDIERRIEETRTSIRAGHGGVMP